ncbi:MAG: hypothetical protein WCN92_10490 [Eubacteriales bacterium]
MKEILSSYGKTACGSVGMTHVPLCGNALFHYWCSRIMRQNGD